MARDKGRKRVDSLNRLVYRTGFWTAFFAGTCIADIASIGFIAHAIAGLMGTAGLEAPLPYWLLMLVLGIGTLITAASYNALLLKWSELVRFARYQEERAKTKIAAMDIDQYAANEAERNEKLLSKMDDNYRKFGRMIEDGLTETKKASEATTKSVAERMQLMAQQMTEITKSMDMFKSEIAESSREMKTRIEMLKVTAAERQEQRQEEAPAAEEQKEPEAEEPAEEEVSEEQMALYRDEIPDSDYEESDEDTEDEYEDEYVF